MYVPLQRGNNRRGLPLATQVAVTVLIEVVERPFDDLFVEHARRRGPRELLQEARPGHRRRRDQRAEGLHLLVVDLLVVVGVEGVEDLAVGERRGGVLDLRAELPAKHTSTSNLSVRGMPGNQVAAGIRLLQEGVVRDARRLPLGGVAVAAGGGLRLGRCGDVSGESGSLPSGSALCCGRAGQREQQEH